MGPVGHGMLSLALAFSKNLLSFGSENAQNSQNHPDLHFLSYPVVKKKALKKQVFFLVTMPLNGACFFVETSPLWEAYAEWFF